MIEAQVRPLRLWGKLEAMISSPKGTLRPSGATSGAYSVRVAATGHKQF